MRGLKIILGLIAVMLVLLVLQHEREHRAVMAQQAAADQEKAEQLRSGPWDISKNPGPEYHPPRN